MYDEAQRGLALQVVLLNELRARTGILLAVIGAATAFLGATAVEDGVLYSWGVGALAAFGLAVGCCLWILCPFPHRGWPFSEDPAKLITNYCRGPRSSGSDWTPDSVRLDLALHMADDRDTIIENMKWMQGQFVAAGVLLAVEIGCWVMEFAG